MSWADLCVMMNLVFFAYIDESGNTGCIASGGTTTYTLGCVTIPAHLWPNAATAYTSFRQRLLATYGVPPDAEIKANYLVHGKGDLRTCSLAVSQRHLIYRAHLRMLHTLGMSAFAVVIDKRRHDLSGTRCFDLAWETLLQRLERKSHYDNDPFLIFHDDGEAAAVRKWARYARTNLTAGSYFGNGSVIRPAVRLTEDPIPRNSRDSPFIQLADLVAYAGFRKKIPYGNSAARVCPPDMWDEIGEACNHNVNKVAGGIPGIVVRDH